MNDLGLNFEMVRFAKCKTTDAVNKCENEHARKSFYADKPNINTELTSTNYIMSNFKGTQMEVFEKQKELYNQKHTRKLRKDAIKALDGVFAFTDASQITDKQLGQCVIDFLDEFMPNCYARIWVHNDEKQKHAHVLVCPIDKNGNCITDKVMNKASFRKMQSKFAEICEKNGIKGISRGIAKADRFEQGLPQNYHKDKWQYAKEMEMKEKEMQIKENAVKTVEDRLANLKNDYNKLEDNYNELADAKEYLDKENKRLAKENAHLAAESEKLTKEIENKTLLRGNEDFDFIGGCLNMNKDGWEEEIAR